MSTFRIDVCWYKEYVNIHLESLNSLFTKITPKSNINHKMNGDWTEYLTALWLLLNNGIVVG